MISPPAACKPGRTSSRAASRRPGATCCSAAGRGRRAGADGTPGAASAGGGRGGGTGAPDGKGNDALLHDLVTGHSLFLGSVEDAAFNRTGDLLAYTVGAAIRDGNGLFAIDLKTGTTHVLDNDAMIYSHPTFTDDGNGIAVLKAKDLPKLREHAVILEAFPDIRAAFSSSPEPASPVLLEPAKAAGFPSGFVLSDRAPLAWSDDNRRVFVSMMPQTAAPDTAAEEEAPTRSPTSTSGARRTNGSSRTRWRGPTPTATTDSARRSM